MLRILPLTIVPLIVYNLFAFGLISAGAGDPWLAPLFTLELPSGVRFTPTSGDFLVIASICLLCAEVLKAAGTGVSTLTDHILSMLVFVVYLVEFLVVPEAAHAVFLTLTTIALIDVIAGFSVSIRAARRDVEIGRERL